MSRADQHELTAWSRCRTPVRRELDQYMSTPRERGPIMANIRQAPPSGRPGLTMPHESARAALCDPDHEPLRAAVGGDRCVSPMGPGALTQEIPFLGCKSPGDYVTNFNFHHLPDGTRAGPKHVSREPTKSA